MKTCAAALLLLAATAAHAAEILDTEVTNDHGRYSVRFDVRLDAPPERLKHYLTDYGHYADYFETVKESQVLRTEPDGTERVRMRLESCVLFFCRSVNVVRDITERPNGVIVARIDPRASDFRESTETWRIVPDNGRTRLEYRAELVPTFYVPPLIGPWMVKRRIRDALESGAEKLEALAHG